MATQTTNKLPAKDPQIFVKSMKPIKFKNHPENRRSMKINFVKVFGFLPQEIVIEKERSRNNCMIISAVLTPLERQKMEKSLEEAKKAEKEKK